MGHTVLINRHPFVVVGVAALRVFGALMLAKCHLFGFPLPCPTK